MKNTRARIPHFIRSYRSSEKSRTHDHDTKALAAEYWFGYGRWESQHWFIGMEPGGDYTHASYDAWLDLGGDELIDCRAHHQWQLEKQGIDNPDWTKWHRRDRPNILQSTWRPLILLLLAYKGNPSDTEAVRLYQCDEWGKPNGETAVVELNALHAPSREVEVEREKYRPDRIRIIRERLSEHDPRFAVFYGKEYRPFYEESSDASSTQMDLQRWATPYARWCLTLRVPERRTSGGWRWGAKYVAAFRHYDELSR